LCALVTQPDLLRHEGRNKFVLFIKLDNAKTTIAQLFSLWHGDMDSLDQRAVGKIVGDVTFVLGLTVHLDQLAHMRRDCFVLCYYLSLHVELAVMLQFLGLLPLYCQSRFISRLDLVLLLLLSLLVLGFFNGSFRKSCCYAATPSAIASH
jgi:Ca2+/Na+ antiporter